ncbi:hypothetical protein BB559_002693 [Furculomyces boomerangus]|uniref:CCHC-type domain-containing protein n=1 Tax=Furculomyces boomerangus TaxID=61424 RepID=A0A2T9YTB5_9FUNG|nr:hypothetical protein BB559_002693 [Furculomyces boomerangus]
MPSKNNMEPQPGSGKLSDSKEPMTSQSKKPEQTPAADLSFSYPSMFWTPGAAMYHPRNTATFSGFGKTQSELLEAAKKLSCVREENYEGFILPAPGDFSAEWNKDALRWIERFQRHIGSFKKELIYEEILDYAKTFYSGRASKWHDSAAILYEYWEEYVNAFVNEFHPSKNRLVAKEKLKKVNLYSDDALRTYAELKVLFKLVDITSEDEKVNLILGKLNRSDREMVCMLQFTTVHQIMDYLRGRAERDKLYNSRIPIERSNKTKTFPKKLEISKQCFICRKMGHIARNCN